MKAYTDVIFDGTTLEYLKLLSKQYPNINDACTEIINLQAILNLPKGTEHFMSDIHGEFEAFNHVLRNASGVIKIMIDQIFGKSMREAEKRTLATLVYYPEQKLDLIIKQEQNIDDWYKITLYRLIKLCKAVASKYTRSKVRKALPNEFSYIIEELLQENGERKDKSDYYDKIIETIIAIDRAKAFIIAISQLIQRFSIDKLHILGDIFDRGPGAENVMNTLINYHSVDIQWGNHDILWMGAAAGSLPCICNVLRISTRYFNLRTIEEGYGINLLPLATFAMEFYGKDGCGRFQPVLQAGNERSDKEVHLVAMMHKAITIIQFKLEGQLIEKYPSFGMDDRLLLHRIDYEKGTIRVNGAEYKLMDSDFPTIDRKDPYSLTPEESELTDRLKNSFLKSEKLQRHIRFLFTNGSMYLRYNSNLLYHGCIPMEEDGSFTAVMINGSMYRGKKYIDKLERMIRAAYYSNSESEAERTGKDLMWYLWCGPHSPLYGKKSMKTFERYFIEDKSTYTEEMDSYYKFKEDPSVCKAILEEFGLDTDRSRIINGHVPVRVSKGESPVKAGGKLLVIDGGLSRVYHKETGIAGYTLIYDSEGILLASHEPFESASRAIADEVDILSTKIELENTKECIRVGDTDIGDELKKSIEDLKKLVVCYRKGLIKEVR